LSRPGPGLFQEHDQDHDFIFCSRGFPRLTLV